jgi:hypothetical protein
MRRVLASFGLLIVLTTSAFAEPALTISLTRMREAPDPHSRIVQSIPRNAEIDVGECGRYWCAASWRDTPGYVRAGDVSFADRGPPIYEPPPPVVVRPFGFFGYSYGYRRWGY